jgi:hypothetical protein
MTAGGILKTVYSVRDTAVVSGPIRGRNAPTVSTLTDGTAGGRSAAEQSTSGRGASLTRATRGVVTVVTTTGLLKTVLRVSTEPGAPVLLMTSSSTGGPVWTKPVARTVPTLKRAQESTPVADGGKRRTKVSAASIDIDVETAKDDGDELVRTVQVETNDTEGTAVGGMSPQSRQDLSTFISTSVLPKTNRVYEKEWLAFKAFVKDETGSNDPFLTSYVDDERAALVALMTMRRHQARKRGKSACAFMAAVRQMFARTEIHDL